MIEIADHPSPNHGPRPPGTPIDMLVLHYTGMITGQAALARLCDSAAEVSAHYLVFEDGRVLRLVAEHRRAWHAGRSYWRGESDINSRSIGIELVNPGHTWGYKPFPMSQLAALVSLCHALLARHSIPAENVVGHSDIAPDRKEDPGELFPWRELASAGIGYFPSRSEGIPGVPLVSVQTALGRYGYRISPTGSYDLATRNVATAFQRRYRPDRVDGVFDDECAGILLQLLRSAGCAAPAGFLP